jgi:hypothetical protein
MVLDVILFMICTKHEQVQIPMIQQCDDIPIFELINQYQNQQLGIKISNEEEKVISSYFRNRINSDYTTLSSSQTINNFNSSKFPFSFEELNRALIAYDTNDIFQPQQQQEEFSPSTMTNSLTYRTFSSSSSSNSSLTPQYV